MNTVHPDRRLLVCQLCINSEQLIFLRSKPCMTMLERMPEVADTPSTPSQCYTLAILQQGAVMQDYNANQMDASKF